MVSERAAAAAGRSSSCPPSNSTQLPLQLVLLQLEKRIEADTIVARTLIAQKKKERALLALKKKKLSVNQLANIQAYLLNVEGMVRTEQGQGFVGLTKQTCTAAAPLHRRSMCSHCCPDLLC